MSGVTAAAGVIAGATLALCAAALVTTGVARSRIRAGRGTAAWPAVRLAMILVASATAMALTALGLALASGG